MRLYFRSQGYDQKDVSLGILGGGGDFWEDEGWFQKEGIFDLSFNVLVGINQVKKEKEKVVLG